MSIRSIRLFCLLLIPALCTADADDHGVRDQHADRTVIAPEVAAGAGLVTALAGPATLRRTLPLFGRIARDEERVHAVGARYAGLVQSVHVSVGDRVASGDLVARVEARDSLQSQAVLAPAGGVVTARHANPGGASDGGALIEITDTSWVWLDLDVFPRDLPLLSPGQPVLLGGEAVGEVNYIAPMADARSRATLARAVLANNDGRLRPGTLVRAELLLGSETVPLAVRAAAIQELRGEQVVFVRAGDSYEARPIVAGRSDGEWVEVLGGLASATSYVSENSYLVKADILKATAGHDH